MIHLLRSLDASTTRCGAPCGPTAVLHPALATCPRCRRAGALSAMPEGALLEAVRQLAQAHGYLFYHTWRSDHSEAGFPDCILARPGRLIAAELKTARGKLTPAQDRWYRCLQQVPGVEAYIWRPGDLLRLDSLLGEAR